MVATAQLCTGRAAIKNHIITARIRDHMHESLAEGLNKAARFRFSNVAMWEGCVATRGLLTTVEP